MSGMLEEALKLKEEEIVVNDKKITIQFWDGYFRSPHCCRDISVQIYFHDQYGKGSFEHTFYIDSLADDDERINNEGETFLPSGHKDEFYESEALKLYDFIIDLFKSINDKKEIDDSNFTLVQKKAYRCALEGMEAIPEEERQKHEIFADAWTF